MERVLMSEMYLQQLHLKASSVVGKCEGMFSVVHQRAYSGVLRS